MPEKRNKIKTHFIVGRGHDPADQVKMIALVKNDGRCTTLNCVGAVMTAPYDGAADFCRINKDFLNFPRLLLQQPVISVIILESL